MIKCAFLSMKLDKSIVQRRIDLMAAEGIVCTASYLVYSILKFSSDFCP